MDTLSPWERWAERLGWEDGSAAVAREPSVSDAVHEHTDVDPSKHPPRFRGRRASPSAVMELRDFDEQDGRGPQCRPTP